MQKPTWKLSLVLVAGLAALSPGSSRGDDSFAPCWRGGAGTTYESWAFPTSSNPSSPDAFTNPNGTPAAALTVGPFGSGWHSTSFGTKTGVWDLGKAGQISLAVPNYGASAGPWKYVQVQVTYFDSPGFFLPPTIGIAGATLVSSSVVNNQAASGGNWKTTNTVWLIQPSPASETVLINGNANNLLLVDQVIVDTRCPIAGDGDVAAFRPCWRGQAGSTFQQWMFGISNGVSSIQAELKTNSFGNPTAAVSLGSFSSGWVNENSFFGCRQGIWDLGVGGTMTLAVPNTTSASSGAYKYVRLQVTQYRDTLLYTANAGVSISGGTLISQQQQTIETTSFGAEWVVVQSIWRLGPPVPASESIVISAAGNGSLIDQAVVETMIMDFACPANVPGVADPGLCSKANVTWTLPAPNGCTVASVTSTPPSGSTFAVGVTPVHSVITDGEGGTKTCDFNVIIADTQLPTVTCPANITVAKDPSQCGAFVTFTATALDNCPGATAGCVPPSGSLFPLGLTTITCTATDAVGNVSAPCNFTVRVIDFTGDYSSYVPCWRGQPNTTFQQWAYSVSNSLVAIAPELATNLYGAPNASVALGAFSSGWVDQNPFFGCRQGIWDLGVGGTMTLSVPNTTSVSAGAYKYVRIQVTQYRDLLLYTANAGVSMAGATLVSQQQQTVEITGFGGQWVVSQTILRVGPPSPAAEAIVISAAANGSLIDQVVVDTLALDFPCPSDIAGVTDAGQCSKANVTWSLPAVNGCTVSSTTSTPASGSTFPVGITPVHSVITDGEGGTKTCDFNVTITDNQPPVIASTAATEVQPFAGTVAVKNCANQTVQGTVNIVIQASDQCPLLPPIVGLTNGLSGTTAVFVNQSPPGFFNYTWAVTAVTANGTWTATATASDTASSVTSAFTLCVDNSQITGQVELELFGGGGTSPLHSRTVTFRATDATGGGATLLKTWSLLLSNVTGATFNYTLTQVPSGTVAVSAKTAWNLRKKLPVTLLSGQGTANFTGLNKLLGGDVSGNPTLDANSINAADNTLINNNYLQPMPGAAPADVNGSGSVNAADVNFINNNWLKTGDPK